MKKPFDPIRKNRKTWNQNFDPTETKLKIEVRKYLISKGYVVQNVLQGGIGVYKSTPGASDIIAYRNIKHGDILHVETKVKGRKQSLEQIEYQKMIEARGGVYLLVNDLNVLRRYFGEPEIKQMQLDIKVGTKI